LFPAAVPIASDELELCTQAVAGSRAALGRLLERHGPRLYRSILLPRLGNRDAAEEALGTTYTKVVEHISQYVWQDCGIYPWLRTIALRVAIDLLRAKKHEILFSPNDLQRELDCSLAQEHTPDEWQERDLAVARERVIGLLRQLHPRYAEAIRCRVLEGRSREQTAEALGVSLATSDVVLHRALVALKKIISSMNLDSP
jgi:RNA polymerase sigma-70 factor (ECF subfamily)